MKFTFFCFLFLIIFQVEDQSTKEIQWKVMNNLDFKLPTKRYKGDSIYFFKAFVKKEDLSKHAFMDSSFNFYRDAKPLDLYDYWGSRGTEIYNVLFTKTGYMYNQPVDFFSQERLSDVSYIAKTIPSAKISKMDSVYHISIGYGAPTIDYTLHFYSHADFQLNYPSMAGYLDYYDQMEETPALISVQHNFNYGQVFFQKTSKMSVSITRYYQIDKEHTLVYNYTLNYIYNLPPSFLGGSDFLIGKIKEGIKGLIEETQSICNSTQ